ncbi:hypothetical protein EWM64_g2940 [Hericium alpestre]|uniref:DUF6589 domain-containing protein n=1 Tax=Hericium alpestre TaxID=135208 RepID=A0A4Z0A3N6_9AGAM|nr:hypothetical protein EWM64_g2940 [Hericium alpestre]
MSGRRPLCNAYFFALISPMLMAIYRDIVLNNWLANPTGKPNSFVDVDLVQEHLNFWIKLTIPRVNNENDAPELDATEADAESDEQANADNAIDEDLADDLEAGIQSGLELLGEDDVALDMDVDEAMMEDMLDEDDSFGLDSGSEAEDEDVDLTIVIIQHSSLRSDHLSMVAEWFQGGQKTPLTLVFINSRGDQDEMIYQEHDYVWDDQDHWASLLSHFPLIRRIIISAYWLISDWPEGNEDNPDQHNWDQSEFSESKLSKEAFLECRVDILAMEKALVDRTVAAVPTLKAMWIMQGEGFEEGCCGVYTFSDMLQEWSREEMSTAEHLQWMVIQ